MSSKSPQPEENPLAQKRPQQHIFTKPSQVAEENLQPSPQPQPAANTNEKATIDQLSNDFRKYFPNAVREIDLAKNYVLAEESMLKLIAHARDTYQVDKARLFDIINAALRPLLTPDIDIQQSIMREQALKAAIKNKG